MCLTLAQAPIRQWRAGSWDNRILDQPVQVGLHGRDLQRGSDHPDDPFYTGMANVFRRKEV